MKATTFDVEGLVKGYLRGTAWHCTYYTPAGRQRRKLGTKNKRQAERRAREISDLIQRETWDDLENLSWKPKPQAGTLATFIRDEFEPKYAPWGPRTRKGNAARLRIICRQFGSRPLGSLTAREVKTWLARRQAEGASAATSNRYLSVLKGVYKAAVTYGYVKNNPVEVLKAQSEPVKVKDVLDDDEFERLLSELPDYARRIVLVAVETGMRRSEIARLKWEDVELVAGELRVAEAKNGEFRIVPFTDRLAHMLAELKDKAIPHPTADVFYQGDIKKSLAGALKRAGIEKHVTLHSFRHQFATRALEAGVSSFHLQAIGGWKSPVMLQRYGKVRNKALHEQMAKLDDANPGRRV